MGKKKILVAGGMGYIGSHTTVELLAAGYDVVIADDLSNSKIEVLDGIEKISGVRPPFYQISCNDEGAMRDMFRKEGHIDGVIHFVAFKAVGESVQKPLEYYYNNVVSLITVLNMMKEFNTQGIVFSSSCTVYGQPDPENLPVTEKAPIKAATSPYGASKQINEEIIRDAVHADYTHFKGIALRYFNPIGGHESALIGELPTGIPQNLCPYLTQAAAGIRKELTVFGTDYDTPDGSCIRDYIDVVDLSRAHVKAMDRMLGDEKTPDMEYFNIGTGHGVSVLELINSFEKATGVKVPHKIGPRREGDIEKVWADPTFANEVLGWKATIPLEETLRNAWKWQLKIKDQQMGK